MAVTVIKRPQGHILNATIKDALVTDDYGNQGALFDDPNHGLIDGDYIYVSSNVSNYNGFWYVDIVNSRFFWLREYATKTRLPWVVDAVVNYQKADLTHGWSCVHLPIVYKLSNDRWPINSIDTVRTISSVIDNNGYCELSLSGDIKTSGSANELDYVKVSTGALAGVYQITQWVSDTNFVINVLYSAANDTALTSASIQYYYNNYVIRVRVFAGLSASHFWTALKPYEQVVDLKLVPDLTNVVDVNVNEYIKNQIEVLSNNLALASLPNDIDSFCQFYISTAETYDETDGEIQTTSTPSFTADSSNFEGVAVNAMLPFKNKYSGYLSEYLSYNLSKFITLFDQPRLFQGYYFDISFLVRDTELKIKKDFYNAQGVLMYTSTEDLPEYSLGLYKHEITIPANSTEMRVDFTIIGTLLSLSSWTNEEIGSIDWSLGSTPLCALPVMFNQSDLLHGSLEQDDVLILAGKTYVISYEINFGGNPSTQIQFSSYNGLVVAELLATVTNTGLKTGSITITPTLNADSIVIQATNLASGGNTVIVYSISLPIPISETKTINIDNECSFQDIYLTWKNYLGGMEYWKFTAQKDYIASVESVTESAKNIYPAWPNSYGEFADTIERDTSRSSRDKIVVRSQNVTEDELNAIRYIVSSPLVQIMVSRNDRRTVLVEPGSFTWKRDEDKLYNIEFEIRYTNTIPSQSL